MASSSPPLSLACAACGRLPPSPWRGDLDEPRTRFAGLGVALGERDEGPTLEKGDLGETRMGAMLPQRLPPSPWPGDLHEARTMFAGLGGELRDKRLAREKSGLGEEPVELGERDEGPPAREEGVALRTDSPSASSSVDESTIRLRACLCQLMLLHTSPLAVSRCCWFLT